MFEGLRDVLAADPRVAYALLFGSTARGSAHRSSDLDIAVGLRDGVSLPVLEIGAFITRLEGAAGHPVDLVLLDEAPPSIAYRVFRDGRALFSRDDRALAARRARAILEYLDFQPFEGLFVRSVLEPRRGR
jgi:predicted nucleotidyltransferase